MNYEATPRGPLKRTRKRSTKQPPTEVSGSRDLENGITEEGKLKGIYLHLYMTYFFFSL